MATAQSTESVPVQPPNIDLIRRYCPSLATHAPEQLAAHLHPDAQGCWPWDGAIGSDGYAIISCEPTAYGLPQTVPTHRYMFDILVGDVPYGYHVHHRCQVKHCWNLFHLKAVTPREHCYEHRLLP